MSSYLLAFWVNLCIFAQTRQCQRDPFHRNCYQDADLESIYGIDLSGSPLELTLSPELAMFFAFLLRFVVYHFVGLALCWICTIKFRS